MSQAQVYDVIVIGGGPAGLAAALTLATDGRKVALLEKSGRLGGQAGSSPLIENILCHPEGLSGADFCTVTASQLVKFGVEIRYNFPVNYIGVDGSDFAVGIVGWRTPADLLGRAVLIATGLSNRWIGIPGEDLPNVYHGLDGHKDFDAAGKHVVLVGGGNSVGQAACYYLNRGAQVTIIAKRPVRETMDGYLVDRLLDVDANRFDIVYGEVNAILGGSMLQVVVGLRNVWAVDAVHILVGQAPDTGWLSGLVWGLRKGGYIITNHFQTNVPGIFAVGDVVSGSVKRAGCAMGAGYQVVPVINAYLTELDGYTRFDLPAIKGE